MARRGQAETDDNPHTLSTNNTRTDTMTTEIYVIGLSDHARNFLGGVHNEEQLTDDIELDDYAQDHFEDFIDWATSQGINLVGGPFVSMRPEAHFVFVAPYTLPVVAIITKTGDSELVRNVSSTGTIS